MRPWSLILLVCAGCTVRLPRPAEVGISVEARARVEVRGQAPPPPPPPAPAVALEGAPVVEFFGVPLEGAQDIVFVLDCSGSMADPARGRIAQIHVDQSAAPPPPSSPPADAPPPSPPPYGPPPPPSSTPPTPPPPPPGAAPPTGDASPPVDPSAPPGVEPNVAPPAPPPPRKIDVAQAELVAALAQLPAGTRMNVLFFNRDVDGFAPELFVLDDAGRTNLIAFVNRTEPVGSTALVPAMRTAFLFNARRIVLLSDGLGNVGGGMQALMRDAREAIRGGVRIDTIGLGLDQDARVLGALAAESGGLYQPL